VLTNEVVRSTSFAVAYAQAKPLSLTASLGEQGTSGQASPKLGYNPLSLRVGHSFAIQAAELNLALRTKERLAQLLRVGPVEIERKGQDRYRRTPARLSAGGKDAGGAGC
jgi:hypothetical protein